MSAIDDVEGAVVAAVGDPGDLALQMALAAGDRDPVAVAHQLRHLGAVDLVRQAGDGDDVRVLVVGPEALQPERLDPGPRASGEQRVAGEGPLEALLEQQLERHVERAKQRHGRA